MYLEVHFVDIFKPLAQGWFLESLQEGAKCDAR